jgi:type II secretion system protein D
VSGDPARIAVHASRALQLWKQQSMADIQKIWQSSQQFRWLVVTACLLVGVIVIIIVRSSDDKVIAAGPQNSNAAVGPVQAPSPPLYADDKNSAQQSALSIQAYTVPQGKINQQLAQWRQRFGSIAGVQFVEDARTGRILINAPETVHQQIAQQLQTAAEDKVPGAAQFGQQVIGLSHIGWPEIHGALARIWGPNLKVTSPNGAHLRVLALPVATGQSVEMSFDQNARRVEVKGPASPVAAWSNFLRALDKPAAGQDEQTQVVPLRRARRAKVQTALAAFQQDQPDANDQPPPAAPIPNGAAQQPVAQGGGGVDEAPIGPVQIEFIEGLDVIIVRGNPRDVERVTKIIEDIERLSEQTEPDIRVLQLQHVNSEALAELLVPLYDQVLQSRQGRVSITALVNPNALLLIGRPDSVEAVVALIEQLDQPVPPTTQVTVFQLKHVAATGAEQMIREFYEERGGLGPRIRILSDVRSNAVIVQASPRDASEIGELIQKLDVTRAKAINEVRVFRLTNSLAEELADVLEAAIQNQQTGAPGGGQQAPGAGQNQQNRSAMLMLKTLDSESRKILRSGIFSDVRVTADIRANAIVVTGPPENMELIGELIRQLDQLPSAESQIKVFTIVNGDALGLVEVLEDLFGQTTAGGGQFGQQQLGTDTSLVPLRFSVDQRTNSVIVSGAISDLEVVEAILLRLDESDIRERQNTVYRLNNAPAIDVANAINEFLRSQRQVEQLAPETISPFEQIEREVIVVPEPVNNSLIISATPRYYEEIMKLVEGLDKRPPMVLIQVLIAEVVLDDFDEMGIELGVQDSLLFDRSTIVNNVLNPGFLFNNQQLGNDPGAASVGTRDHFGPQVLSSFAVARSNSELGYGGLVISGGNDEVSILIRALQDDRRLDVLSRPQVMTLDNQPAFVQVGQRVPRITSSQITNGGTVINNTVLENVGILLGVTPRISPEGLVVMEIDAEKSRLGSVDDGIPISINNNGDVIRSPIIDTITAQTTVSAASGQTVILGGLITKNDQTIARRVPHLSEIPILGSLFRFDSIDRRRTELLFIMTPYIVRDDDDIEMVKQMESQRMSWCLADVVSIHGEHNLSENGNSHVACWDCGPTKVIYPDLMPTLPQEMEYPEPVPSPTPLRQPVPMPGPAIPETSDGNSIMLRPGAASPAGYYPPVGNGQPLPGNWQPGPSPLLEGRGWERGAASDIVPRAPYAPPPTRPLWQRP